MWRGYFLLHSHYKRILWHKIGRGSNNNVVKSRLKNRVNITDLLHLCKALELTRYDVLESRRLLGNGGSLSSLKREDGEFVTDKMCQYLAKFGMITVCLHYRPWH